MIDKIKTIVCGLLTIAAITSGFYSFYVDAIPAGVMFLVFGICLSQLTGAYIDIWKESN